MEEDLLVPTYSDDGLIEAKKTGNIFFSDSGLYSFAVDKSFSSVKEARGSPVLNKQGDIVGVVLKEQPNTMLTLRSSYLREFVAGTEAWIAPVLIVSRAVFEKQWTILKNRLMGTCRISVSVISYVLSSRRRKRGALVARMDKKPAQSGKKLCL